MDTFQKLEFKLSSSCRLELQSTYANKPLKPLDWVFIKLISGDAQFDLGKEVLECEIADYAIVLEDLCAGKLQSDEPHLFAILSDVDQYNLLQSDESLHLSHPEYRVDHGYLWYGSFRLKYGRAKSVWVFSQDNRYFLQVTKNFNFDPWLDNMPTPSQYKDLASKTPELWVTEVDLETIRSTTNNLQKLHKMACEYHQWKSDFDLEI